MSETAGVASQVPRERVRALRDREARRFTELRPRGTQLLDRARASMPNGVPMAWMATMYDHPPIVVKSGSGAAFIDIDGTAISIAVRLSRGFDNHGVVVVGERPFASLVCRALASPPGAHKV